MNGFTTRRNVINSFSFSFSFSNRIYTVKKKKYIYIYIFSILLLFLCVFSFFLCFLYSFGERDYFILPVRNRIFACFKEILPCLCCTFLNLEK